MVIVIPAQTVDMQGDPRSAGKAVEAVRDHLGAEVANLLAFKPEVGHAVRTVRQIDDGTAEGLVERCVGRPKASQPRGRAERSREGVTQRDADVFGRVMVIDCKDCELRREMSVYCVSTEQAHARPG